MNTTRKPGPPLVKASVAVMTDCKRLVGSCYGLLVAVLLSLPREIMLAIVLISLAVLERRIEMGSFDTWIA